MDVFKKGSSFYVSAGIADIVYERAQYIKNKAMDDQYYMDMIVNYLSKWGKGTKVDFVKLLSDKLPDILDKKQKDDKIRNLLSKMRRDGKIRNISTARKNAIWELC